MIQMSMKDIREMKRMGWMIKALYKNHRGVPFTKSFKDRTEMDDFTKKAESAGSSLIEYREI